VQNLVVNQGDVTIYGLRVGSPTSPFGLQVVNCDNVIVLDEVSARAQVTGLRIDDSSKVALQLVECRGTQALVVTNQSIVFASRGDVSNLSVTIGSHVRHAGLTLGPASNDGTSSITAIPGVSPRLDFPLAWSGLQSYQLTVAAAPSDFYLLQAGFGRAFVDLSAFLPIDMVALMDPGASFSVGSGLVGPTGTVSLSAVAPDSPAAWGSALSLQVVVLRTAAARPFVLGNVRDLFFVP